MIRPDDMDYDRERERQERLACAAARDVAVRHIHQELADRYADRVWSRREAQCAAGNSC